MNEELYNRDPKYREMIDSYRKACEESNARKVVEVCPKCYFMDKSLDPMQGYRCYGSKGCPAYARDHAVVKGII